MMCAFGVNLPLFTVHWHVSNYSLTGLLPLAALTYCKIEDETGAAIVESVARWGTIDDSLGNSSFDSLYYLAKLRSGNAFKEKVCRD